MVPLAPLPLSGRNTVPCSLISTPPGWVVFGRSGRMLPGFAALRMRRVPYGENRFFFCGKRGMFLSCSCFFACPAGAKTTFSFAPQKKKRFWTPKKKRWTSGNDYGLRYNRIKSQPCLVIPWVKDFRVSLLFPAACV